MSDVPMFNGTEDAMRYGRHLRRALSPDHDQFQTLVRTWMVSQRAVANAINPQAKVILATRCQLLREAVEAFFETRTDSSAGLSTNDSQLSTVLEVGHS